VTLQDNTQIIPSPSFAATKREKLLNHHAYAAVADDLIMRIRRSTTRLKDPAWLADKDTESLMLMTWGRAGYAIDLIALQYSAGARIEDLRALFVATLGYFEEYAKFSVRHNADQGPGHQAPHIPLGDAEFDKANRLVCLAILLGLERTLGRVSALIDYNCSMHDGMLERLLSVFVEGRTMPEGCTRHLPYFNTLKIFTSAPNHRAALMREYLNDWYSASRREPYHESHKRDDVFRGYWSWEAGAITIALNIDDTTFCDAEFYPRDLVDFARQARQTCSPAGLLEAMPQQS
jgi:hypothetical protein